MEDRLSLLISIFEHLPKPSLQMLAQEAGVTVGTLRHWERQQHRPQLPRLGPLIEAAARLLALDEGELAFWLRHGERRMQRLMRQRLLSAARLGLSLPPPPPRGRRKMKPVEPVLWTFGTGDPAPSP